MFRLPPWGSRHRPERGVTGRSPVSPEHSQETCVRPAAQARGGRGGGRAACGGSLRSATEHSPGTRDTCHRPVTPELDTERMSTATTCAPGTAGSPAPRGPPRRGQGRSWCGDLETQWLSDRNKGQRPSPSGLMAGDAGSCHWMLPRKWQGEGLGEEPCS